MKTLTPILKLVSIPLLAVLGLGLAILALIGIWTLLYFLLAESWLTYLMPAIGFYIVGCCIVALIVGVQKLAGRPSRPFRLGHPVALAILAVLSVPLGLISIAQKDLGLFWLVFVLTAALPPLTALAIASRRLAGVTSWRRVMAGILSGSLLSTHLAVLLTAGVSLLAYAVIVPLRDTWAHIIASGSLERLFYSPALIGVIIAVAVVAPLVEELTKPIAAILLARRLRSPAEAFIVGMAGGVGFAILENLLYEASGARVWAGVAAIRAIGGVLHPLNAGLVAMGWYAVRNGQPGAWRKLGSYYALAVGAHALWNGGLTLLFAGVGAHFFGTQTWIVDIYGLGQPAAVILFMLIEAAIMWRLLFAITDALRGAPIVQQAMPLQVDRSRRLAVWAVGVLASLAIVGALYAPLVANYSQRFVPLG